MRSQSFIHRLQLLLKKFAIHSNFTVHRKEGYEDQYQLTIGGEDFNMLRRLIDFKRQNLNIGENTGKFMNNNVWFQGKQYRIAKVTKTEQIKSPLLVQDFTCHPSESFIANGILTHNCHRLPAPMWSRFATLQTKYRLGFSATPYREDGREDLIMALTGYPVGLSWEQFLIARSIRKPRVICKVVSTDREKTTVLEDLLKVPLKTLIFVELIASGERIKKQFNLPFIYGATKDRLDIISKNLVTVVSRVGDEGISIKDLERTIEVEFLGKSRRQEAQRAYRLLHSVREDIVHIVIMTVKELDEFGKRFLALEEKGFKVEYEMA
jgi:superfamily II DNA or RNA helicase